MEFSNKIALVTGAAVGIGRACALQLAEGGATVVAVDLNGEGAEKVKNEINERGGKAFAYACDVSDEAAVAALCASVKENVGKVDILVNNAGIWRLWKNFLEVSTDEWRKFMDVNLMGTVYFTKELLPDMLDATWGRIINVASVAGVYGNAYSVHYSASKGAMISMTKALAKEVAEKGVTVNAVSPGSVSDSAVEDINYTSTSDLCYMGRTGSDAENASLILYLASDAASYVSGQNIQIDGCRKRL
jgi:NAD(P)-dependent dehydrogenase (short-subunit alcohol dehydrogenase family)